jgi:hypothetical protein
MFKKERRREVFEKRMSVGKTVFGWFVFLFTFWTSMAFGAIPLSSPATRSATVQAVNLDAEITVTLH